MSNLRRTLKLVAVINTLDDTMLAGEACMDFDHVQDGAQPELRIIRQASIEPTPTSYEWHQFLDRMGHMSYGKGMALALGTVHETVVSAREMSIMLQEKYPKVCQNRNKLADLHNRLRKDFNQFVRANGQDVIDTVFGDLSLTGPAEIDRAIEERVDGRIWNGGSFVVGSLELDLGTGRDLGFTFSPEDEQVLDEESRRVFEFLGSNGLNTNKIDENRRRHLTVFKLFNHLKKPDGVRLPSEHPVRIDLLPPKALASK